MKRNSRATVLLAIAAVAALLTAVPFERAEAQYFGRNKVQYQDFNFRILKTQHFDIYYYPEEHVAAELVGRMAERWYMRWSTILHHQLSGRQPLILYASGPQFAQTNAISGQLGEGTGGVTEVLKRRIVLPVGGSLEETDHVVGHELVHAFQYDITGQGRVSTGNYPGALRLPLWFIEGMAEYLPYGPKDPNTAMWIRDQATRKLPTIEDLSDDYKWFPYRYGEALWAYLTGRYGDEIVGELLRRAGASNDPAAAIERALGTTLKGLSASWHRSIHEAYDPLLKETVPVSDYGKVILGQGKPGHYNVSPVLSPDGNKIAFISSRGLFSIDVYIADAHTGEVLKKITNTAVDPHFESLEFISSAGAWSPDGKYFVFAGVTKGKSVLSIVNAETGEREPDIPLPGVDEAFTPSWSPDGRSIVFSGLTGGFTDLFIYDRQTKSLERLTNDPYADLQPTWSPDGTEIAFSTDRFTTNLDSLAYGNLRVALMDPSTKRITLVPGFENGKNLNPQWAPDGKSLYFISDRNGIDNLYSVNVQDGTLTQLTNLYVGISGITATSPALTVASKSGAVAFSVYDNGGYQIFAASTSAMAQGTPVRPKFASVDPALLPPIGRAPSTLTSLLADQTAGLPDTVEFKAAKYHSSLSLDYVSQPSLLLGSDRFGTYIGGGAALYWSDMLGNHNLATMLQVNGTLKDVAGVVQYVNLTHRLNWGVVAQQIPYLLTYYNAGIVSDTSGNPYYVEQLEKFRQTDRQLGGLVSYPFNQVERLEFQAGLQNITFDHTLEQIVTDYYTGQPVSDTTYNIGTYKALNLATTSAALVYDDAFYGATGPILGRRFRFELSPVLGSLDMLNVTADFRQYWMPVRPFTIALRLLHYGRYFGQSQDQRLTPLFLGYPDLVPGYQDGSFSANECVPKPGDSCPIVTQLLGSRIAVANLELRFPLLGVLGVGSGYYGAFPIEAGFFGASGLAWGYLGQTANQPWFVSGGTRKPVYSAGALIRLNLFGFAVIQVDYARAFNRHKGLWEFSFTPGF
ncbi:MAG TPA: hypothetical protein VJ992_05685 [Gemmatimonadales bacterium]|nr:hypothetical protein [Gemmatimonadales bacterium]